MDRSPEGYARRNAANQEVLAKLAKIDRKSLSKTDQLNYDLFQKRYLDRIEQYKVRWFLMSFNQREGPQTSDDLGSSLRFETVKDYEDWLARLRAVPTAMDQFTALLREGIKERMVHPRVIMERIPAQIDKQIVSDPTQSGFYKPFKSFPAAISPADQQRLQQEARQAVEQQVVPAFTKFKQFFRERISARVLRPGGRVAASARRRALRSDDPPLHHHQHDAGRGPPDRLERSGADQSRDGPRDAADRIQRIAR